jgi:hypothetical protein
VTPAIKTLSGRRINPLDVRLEDINIHDLAHGLSMINRFNGNTRRPIDVAYHSVWVSRLAAMFAPEGRQFQAALQGLFHDGSDYIMGDVTKWLKRTETMRGFREYEDAAQRVVYMKFGCELEMLPEVKAADDLMVRVEAEDTWGPNWSIVDGYGPLNETQRALVEGWNPFSWGTSREAFLAAYRELAVSY